MDISEQRHVTDFGKGFYVTNNFQRACIWAKSKHDFVLFKGKFNSNEIRSAVVKIEINIQSLIDLQGIVYEELNKDWANFIYRCRKDGFYNKLYHNYDYVCGWIADNNVAKLSSRIKHSSIPSEEFLASILPNLFYGDQYQLSLNTKRAVQCIMKKEVMYV